MESVAITNAILVDIDPLRVRRGGVRIANGTIVAAGRDVTAQPGDQAHDCKGAVVLPGLVNGHTHLYSALACGMPPPNESPENFVQILERVWWRLDRALDAGSIEASAVIGAIEALRCGTTTLIDHHASPGCINGSLDMVERGVERVGLRGVLCYEVTDRNGPEGRRAGLTETERYLDKCQRHQHGRFAGMVGGHALFTLDDETLNGMRDLAKEFEVGVHLHLAEDPCDEEKCSSEHQMFLADRLRAHGLLQPPMIFAHGTHLTDADVASISNARSTIAHNARSNMNNSVGYAFIQRMLERLPVILGTDGIGSDMLAELQTAYFKAADEQTGLGPAQIIGMLAGSARRASQSLEVPLGRLEPDHAADLVVTDYVPATPITTDNVAGHIVFGLSSRHVKDVMVDGRWRLRDRALVDLDESAERSTAAESAAGLWKRMQQW